MSPENTQLGSSLNCACLLVLSHKFSERLRNVFETLLLVHSHYNAMYVLEVFMLRLKLAN